MHSSYHNSNFLKSKASITLHQSQCIYEDTDFKSKNKQNNSYQLNKSNNSYLSMLRQKSGFIESKSGFVSMIMAESKVKKNLLTIEQNHNDYSKSPYTNRSILKSYRNHPKILTESDLTDNQDECNFFSEQENQYIQNHHASKQSRRQLKLISNHKKVSSRNIKIQGPLKKQIITQDQSQEPQEEEYVEVPPFSFIPSQKLQIKNFVCETFIKRKHWSLVDLLQLIPHKIIALKNVKKLSVVNCFLNSLEGIQHFECLEEINLRKNQLRQVQELYRIQNKSKISSINVLGNDIQHFHLGRFQNLSQVFPNLTELNDKDYSMLKQREKGDMRKILKKSSKIQNQLKKTLKKQMRRTDRAFLRLNPDLTLQQTDRLNIKDYRQRQNRMTEKDEYSQENGGSYSKNGNSLSRKSNSEIKSPIYSNYCSATSFQKKRQIDDENQVYEIQVSNQNSYSLGDSTNNKTNLKNQALPLREVSLGNIQNVPITKSVKCQQRSPKKIQNSLPNKGNVRSINSDQIPLQTVPIGKNFLQIKTQDLDNQSELNVHLHQPTATFAMQKERQQQCNIENKQFMFKNKKPLENKTKAKRQLRQQEEIFQEFENDDDDSEMSLSRISRISEIPTKRLSNNRRSAPSNVNSKPDNRSRYDINENNSEQSFMTGNDLYPNCQNASYMAYSQLSQFRPNESMDDECLLKDNKDGLEQQKLAIASAVYMRNLITKSLFALFLEAKKRKNLPKKRIFI